MIISSLFISFPHLYGISDTGSRTKESDTKNGKRSDSNEKTTLTMEEYEKLQHQAAQLDQKYREQSPYLPIVINLSLLCSTIALVAVGITSHYCLEESNRKIVNFCGLGAILAGAFTTLTYFSIRENYALHSTNFYNKYVASSSSKNEKKVSTK